MASATYLLLLFIKFFFYETLALIYHHIAITKKLGPVRSQIPPISQKVQVEII